MRTCTGGGVIERQVRPLFVVCASAVQRPEDWVQPTVPSAQPSLPTNVRSATWKPFSGPERGTDVVLDEAAGDEGALTDGVVGGFDDGALPVVLVLPEPFVLDVQPATSRAVAAQAAVRRRITEVP